MKIPFVIALIVCSGFETVSNAQVEHVVPPASWSWQATSPRLVDERLEQAAASYQERGLPVRLALYDIAFPANADEYRSLGGYAVMLVSALSRSKDELPPKRVYVRMPDSIIELSLISSTSLEVPADTLIARTYGTHRWEGFYLFPVWARRHGVELLMDFAKNRDGFVMQQFEAAGLETIGALPDAEPSKRLPPAEVMMKLINREFPGLVETAAPAATPPAEEEPRVPGY